jgi:peptide/nickel transport system substrate-binding protein
MSFYSRRKYLSLILLVGLFGLLLSSCSNASLEEIVITPEAQVEEISPTETLPLPTATEAPKRSLVVCMGEEPKSLFVYGDSSRSMWSVLEGVYDGPYDVVNYEPKAVILQQIPSLDNGGAAFSAVQVQKGDYVVDANGDLIVLNNNAVVYPSGCYESSCAITWDGQSALSMDQLSAQFTLLPDLKWSDGEPLTSADSVYSFQLAGDPALGLSPYVQQRTASYEAIDDLTVVWKGVPGFYSNQFNMYYWTPLPQHLWGEIPAVELAASEMASRMPVGWGPYTIQEWIDGDHITMAKNENYFRMAEGLPTFDHVVYRFIGDYADQNIAALLAGECDVVDQRSLLIEELETVLTLQNNNQLKVYSTPSAEYEHIELGITPLQYDDGYNPYSDDRPDFFSDIRTRQAIAQCVNREGIISRWLLDQTEIPVGLYPSETLYSLVNPDPLLYDPDAARALLDQVGWKEYDGDPTTPRTAIGIQNILDGTLFEINYVTTTDSLRVKIAEHVKEHLMECGIQVNITTVEPDQLYAAGPQGVLFGRNFDIAQFSWSASTNNPCQHFVSSQIPTAENQWLTVNLGGFRNENYDTLCYEATHTLPAAGDLYTSRQLAVQQSYIDNLPIIPLYYRLKTVVSRTDFCGLTLDASARSALYELESLNYGEQCSQ